MRLTNASTHEARNDVTIREIISRLAAYEDAEEQGKLVKVVTCRECYFRSPDGAGVPVCTGAMAYSSTPDNWFCAGGKAKMDLVTDCNQVKDGGANDGTA